MLDGIASLLQHGLAPTISLSAPFEVGVTCSWLNVKTLTITGNAVGTVALNTRGLVWCLGMRLMITVTRSLVPMITQVSDIRLLGRVFSVLSIGAFRLNIQVFNTNKIFFEIY